MNWNRIWKVGVGVAIALVLAIVAYLVIAKQNLPIPDLGSTGTSNPEPEVVDSDTEPFTLQLLHASDFEAGLAALEDAPR
ncbi:MAG: bifunctional metallophosphatase/5'-nucleotidase, partial [Moorea sp. SIO2I5]|nr:bifunctional metallophosphatase/5'-nucleotidase [Moorena sp. SIO2I5]